MSNNATLTSPVGLQYFQTLGIPLLRGRDFNTQDRADTPGVVIVNETFAKRFLPGQDPIGQHVSLNGVQGPWLEIVGLARDSKYITIGEAPTPFLYQPLTQRHESGMVLLVRMSGDPVLYIPAIRREVQALEHNLPLTNVRTLTELLGLSLFPARMEAILLGGFGLLALLLAAVGLYGVMSYSVARRTREIGIRIALGAERSDVLRLVLREGMTLVTIGIILGLIVAFAVTRLLTGFLSGISPTDPLAFIAIASFLTVVALAASFIPAYRATKIDPLIALRYE
jgi:putative ABC transport system permease protein